MRAKELVRSGIAIAIVTALQACGGGATTGVVPQSPVSSAPLRVDNFQAAFSEYPLPRGQSQPASLTVGPAGAVWFPVLTAVDRVTSGGKITAFSDPRFTLYESVGGGQYSYQNYPGGYGGITSQGGKLWFSATAGNISDIASLSPNGTFSFIPFQTPAQDNLDPISAYASYGGNVYFSFVANIPSDGVGVVAPGSSTYSLFDVQQPATFNFDYMTIGPDHAIYLTAPCCNGNQDGEWFARCQSLSSPCTFVQLTTINQSPRIFQGIASGHDGNLWVVETLGNSIAKISTSGTILAEYPIPTAASFPTQIVSAPDGTLWFTETLGNKIGRITTSGVITEYSVPTPDSGPNGITTCPSQCENAHGRIWFTEARANKVAKLEY